MKSQPRSADFLIKFKKAGNVGDRVLRMKKLAPGRQSALAKTLLDCGLASIGRLLFCSTVSEAHLEFSASHVNQF